jgi:hypothetical protein
MGTRSAIVEITPEGKYRGIYCHNDGNPEYNGLRLVNYYDTPEKVKELIDLGFISSLEKHVKPEVGEQHSFKDPVKDVTVAYRRDRGDDYDDLKAAVGDTLDDVLKSIEYSYVYLFKDGEWYVDDGESDEPKLVKSLNLDTKHL